MKRNFRKNWWMDHKQIFHSCLTCPDCGIISINEDGEYEGLEFCNRSERNIDSFPNIPYWCSRLPKKYSPSHMSIDGMRMAMTNPIPLEKLDEKDIFIPAQIPLSLRMNFLSKEAKELVNLIFFSPTELISNTKEITKQTIRKFFYEKRGWAEKTIQLVFQELKDFVKDF